MTEVAALVSLALLLVLLLPEQPRTRGPQSPPHNQRKPDPPPAPPVKR